jgi:hypothetical protein
MSDKQGIAKLYFNDGCVRARDHVFIAAKIAHLDPDEYDYARLCSYKAPRWGYQDHNWNVVSVCAIESPVSFHALADRGDVAHYSPQTGRVEEQIADSEKYGALSQIRAIGGKLYVCGMQGQVYRRDDAGWVHVDRGILHDKLSPTALHLNGIDGTGPNDIYVVAMSGRVLHYDGKRWNDIDARTNVHLERVHCVAPGETYVCGNNGTFLKITPQGVENRSIDIEDHFWGLTSFQGKIYLATLNAIYEFDGTDVTQVDTGLEPPIDSHRLDARDGQLWSFGVDDLAYFDGSVWTRVIHPDNV